MTTTLIDDDTVSVPFDGEEHECVCGEVTFSVGDAWGMFPDGIVYDADDGQPHSFCPRCERELVVAK